MFVSSALRVPAVPALRAPLLEDQGAPALRVQPALHDLRGLGLLLELLVHVNGPELGVERVDWRDDARFLGPDVPLDRLRDRVRDREDPLPVIKGEPRAPDPLELDAI